MAILKTIYWDQKESGDLVYKYPNHEITLGSVLTVNESQEAFFFKNGTLYDSFKKGRYILSTSNLPLLNKIIDLPTGGDTTFLAEVWFVSKADRRNLFWGTGGLRIIDPYFEIPLQLYGRGGYGVRIKDGALFLKKFIGTLENASYDFIEEQFRSSVVEAVKVTIASFMKEQGLNVNELGTEYSHLGKSISTNLQRIFDDYGVQLLNFNIEEINFDDNDPGYKKVLDGIAERVRLKKLGVSYVQNRNIDIAEKAAGNPGAGIMMGVGMGLGTGQALGNMVNSAIQDSGIGIGSAPVPPPDAEPILNYYVSQNGKTTGPFNTAQLKDLVVKGVLSLKTYVYEVGGTAWVRAGNDMKISKLFNTMAPPPPPPAD